MNVLIGYGSTTGNTASIAEALSNQIGKAGHEVTLINAVDAMPEGLCDTYEVVLFGCSAWGTDEIELQEDFASLYDAFDQIGVKEKRWHVLPAETVDLKLFVELSML
jgi:flavodoxin